MIATDERLQADVCFTPLQLAPVEHAPLPVGLNCGKVDRPKSDSVFSTFIDCR